MHFVQFAYTFLSYLYKRGMMLYMQIKNFLKFLILSRSRPCFKRKISQTKKLPGFIPAASIFIALELIQLLTEWPQACFFISDILPGNIKCCPMIYGSSDYAALEPYGNIDSSLNSHDLDRGMSLIMITGNDNIKISTASPEEQCICRKRPAYIDSLTLCPFY